MVPEEPDKPVFAVNIPMPTPEAPKPNFIELAVEGIKRVGSGTFDGAMAIGAATVNGVKFVGGGVGAGFLAVFGEGIDKTDTGLEAAFAKVDTDKNGKIDAAEMKAYILSVYDKELDLKIIDEMMTADTNKNGEIDLAEFKAIMRAGPQKSDGAVVEGAKVVGTATVNGAKATGGLVVTGLQKTGVTAGFQAVFGKGIDKSDAGLEASTHSRRHVRLNGRRCESSQSHQPFRTRERLPAVGKVLRGSGVPCRCARLAPAPWPVRCGVWASRHGHAPRPWARCKVSSISTGT